MLFGPPGSAEVGKPSFLVTSRSAYAIKNMALAERLDIRDMDLAPGECCTVVTKARINGFSFVSSFVRRFGHIDALAMATYRIGKETATELEAMTKSGTVAACDLLVNDNMASMKPEICEMLVAKSEPEAMVSPSLPMRRS